MVNTGQAYIQHQLGWMAITEKLKNLYWKMPVGKWDPQIFYEPDNILGALLLQMVIR